MPRLNLTDEEARHIEQRRANEQLKRRGYLDAISDIEAWVYKTFEEGAEPQTIVEAISLRHLRAQFELMKGLRS